jgi:hypothetical protein
MKRLLSLVLSFCILYTATLPIAQKSEAVVGLLIRNRTTAVVGGLTAGSGIIFSSIIYGAAVSSGATGLAALQVAIYATIFVSLGWTAAVLGIVVLDDKSVNDFKFLPLDNRDNHDAINVYNSEIDQLNAIKERIEYEYDQNPKIDTKSLWNEYAQSLSPETFSVAQAIADGFVKQLQPIK